MIGQKCDREGCEDDGVILVADPSGEAGIVWICDRHYREMGGVIELEGALSFILSLTGKENK